MGRPQLGAAVLPVSITESRVRPRIAQSIFSLADAKDAIGLGTGDATDDADLLQQIDNCQALLERLSGISLGGESATAEWCLRGKTAVLKINRSDVQAVSSVQELDGQGVATTLAAGSYETLDYLRQLHIRRTDGNYFEPQGSDIAVVVEFTRGIAAGEQASRHVNMAMRWLLSESQREGGILTDERVMLYKPFQRLMAAMRGNNFAGKVIG